MAPQLTSTTKRILTLIPLQRSPKDTLARHEAFHVLCFLSDEKVATEALLEILLAAVQSQQCLTHT